MDAWKMRICRGTAESVHMCPSTQYVSAIVHSPCVLCCVSSPSVASAVLCVAENAGFLVLLQGVYMQWISALLLLCVSVRRVCTQKDRERKERHEYTERRITAMQYTCQ